MIDLRGIARRLNLSVEQIRIVADLLEQAYQPSFIERYRADETGNLSRSVLWALKLEVDRQQRLEEAREKAKSQLPKGATLDEEVEKHLAEASTENEIEVAMRCWRARRTHLQSPQRDTAAEKLLEALVSFSGDSSADIVALAKESLTDDSEDAAQVVERTQRLVGTLLHGDTSLATKLRRTLQKRAKLEVEYIEDSAKAAAKSDAEESDATSSAEETSAPAEVSSNLAPEPTAQAVEATDSSATEVSSESASENAVVEASSATADSSASDSQSPTETKAADNATAEAPQSVEETEAGASESSTTETSETSESSEAAETNSNSDSDASDVSASEQPAQEEADANLTFTEKGAAKDKSKKDAKQKAASKLTPRQRRRRWLSAMIQPMKSLKKSAADLTAYQQLMLGRGRRSQIVKTHLKYDENAVVHAARDAFVNNKHPLAKWFETAAKEALDASLRAKIEADVLNQLEELAQEKLLETSTDRLRQTLMQRPIRGHVVLVVDTVGPSSASVAVVGPNGDVLHTDEVTCSAQPDAVSANVIHLGQLAHRFKVTLVALTNGPARRFLVLSVRELIKQSAESGLRWTMADRGGADAYATGKTALRELPAYNRRDRAAIWVGRCLQDPLSELLKVDVNRLRLGSFQRELPQEPLKRLVQATIADCVCSRGLDTHHASVEGLACIPGINDSQAGQISEMASGLKLKTREQLVSEISDWDSKDSRQAIGFLRVFGSDQPLDATLIHPEDYRLADRLISNTELELPASSPENWNPPTAAPEPKAEAQEASTDSETTESETTVESSEGSSDSTTEQVAESNSPENADTSDEAATTEDTNAGEAAAEPTSAEASAAESEGATESAKEDTEQAKDAEPSDDSPEAQEETPAGSEAESTNEETSNTAEEKLADESSAPSVKPEYPEEVLAARSDSATKTLQVDIEKYARGWQVGREKLRWIISCLADPFGDTRLSGTPVPMLTDVPTLTTLQPDTCLWAVVVGVADFGAFVELAPDCSGLIHISRLSANYVEDPHQVVQVGDLIMVWVVSVDEKKNRVALTALSPEQRKAQEKSSDRNQRGAQRRDGDRSGGRGKPGGGNRGGASGGRGKDGDRDRKPNRGRGGGRPGGGGDRKGRGRRGGRDSEKQPKSVVIKSKKPVAPISSKMKEGEEPLRSFSDLMQFYEAQRTDDVPPPKSETAPKPESEPAATDTATPEVSEPATSETTNSANADSQNSNES